MSRTASRIFWVLLFMLFSALAWREASATLVSGQIKFQGQPFNGYLTVALSYPGSTGSYLNMPGAGPGGYIRISNGYFPAMNLDGNDTMLPTQTYYQFSYYDSYQQPLARVNYYVSGDSYDIGAAVPTPITPANLSYLDLLGLRQVSTQNLNVSGTFTFGNGMALAPSGISNAQQIMGIRYAAAYTQFSSTCGIQEAIAALPATGGEVILPPGNCNVTAGITVNRPLLLVGMGGGGGDIASGVYNFSSVLFNFSGTNMFTVTPAATTPLVGVEFRDFGVSGSTTTDCFVLRGGAPGAAYVGHVTFSSMSITGCADGIHLIDTVTGVAVTNSVISANAGSGIYAESPSAGLQTAVSVTHSASSGNTIDGITLAATAATQLTVTDSVFTVNVNDGIHLVAGSATSTVLATGSLFSGNHDSGIKLEDGAGHIIADSRFTAGSFQQHGIYANLPTNADAYQTQLTVRGNQLSGNLTDDFYESAAASYILFYPPATDRLGSASVHYSINNAAAMNYIAPGGKINPTIVDVTASRAFGVAYHNTGLNQIIVHATGFIPGGVGQGFGLSCKVGPTSTSMSFVTTASIHNDQGQATNTCEVPSGDWYELYQDNLYVGNPQTPTLSHWIEMVY